MKISAKPGRLGSGAASQANDQDDRGLGRCSIATVSKALAEFFGRCPGHPATRVRGGGKQYVTPAAAA